MKKQQLVALAILAIVIAWMYIPRSGTSTAEVPEGPETTSRVVEAVAVDQPASENPDVISVRAERISPEAYIEQLMVRGRTQAFRHVQVRAEQAGRIVNDPVPRGTRVAAGDLLCEIAVDDREVNLQEATARREQAQFEYDASVDLQRRDLQSDVVVAQLKAALESAKAAVTRAEIALKNTRIIAPFDGIVETRTMEMGDLLNIGDVCASILDDSPMLLVGLVPEQEIGRIEVGAGVIGNLLNGQSVTGRVSYLATAADTASRSYRIEVEVDPGQESLREGITTEILVDAAELMAHRIPSSSLTLDDNGEIGVKLIDSRGLVSFQNVAIVGDDTNQLNPGIWVTGLNGQVNLITVGQEIVFPGQTVNANFDWDQ
ncbi:MAG: efflux RND transporter periplasmic adaptor subunit [Pseudomonadales bacterium]|nr:efflux RND transporter periplasmic adaptor subunit [Pseudomonadales bacterium]